MKINYSNFRLISSCCSADMQPEHNRCPDCKENNLGVYVDDEGNDIPEHIIALHEEQI